LSMRGLRFSVLAVAKKKAAGAIADGPSCSDQRRYLAIVNLWIMWCA